MTEIGGVTSHSAIMARSLGIPAVVGVESITNAVNNGDVVVFDGGKGEVYLNPEEDIIYKYKKGKKAYQKFRNKFNELVGMKSV